MADVLISFKAIFDRLCVEEQQLKRLGLHGQAAGLREAITILIRLRHASSADDSPSLEPSP